VGYSYKPKYLTLPFKIYTQLFARFLFKIPKTVTTYGKALLPYAKKAGVPLKKLRIIPTGIHLNKFQNVNKNKIKNLKKEFNIKNEKIILFVGMLTERKGVDKVINISQKLLKENHNIKTLIVGDAHGKNIYQKLVKPEFKSKIIFTGGRKDIPELMHLANVLLLPSKGEGLPGVVMEAMASRLPVVATKEGCTPDLIEELARTNNEYYSTVKMILNNKNNLAKTHLNKIKDYDWKIIKNKYETLYQN
jgi:UDP-glucose:(heptosyl)LPS alpha-1,3-glucosyltransferase